MSFIVSFQAADTQTVKTVYYLKLLNMLSGSLMGNSWVNVVTEYPTAHCIPSVLNARCFRSLRTPCCILSCSRTDQVTLMRQAGWRDCIPLLSLSMRTLSSERMWLLLSLSPDTHKAAVIHHPAFIILLFKHSGQIWPITAVNNTLLFLQTNRIR